MYEENLTPLPPGDLSVVFAEILADMQRDATVGTAPVSPETVLQYSNRANLQRFGAISRRLLLPGSRIDGGEHLAELGRRAAAGESC